MKLDAFDGPAWRDSDALKAFPVELGDVWRVGNAIFACDDMVTADAPGLLARARAAAPGFAGRLVMYTEPPLRQFSATKWRSCAAQVAGVGLINESYNDLVKALCDLAGECSDALILVGFYKNVPPVVQAMFKRGWQVQAGVLVDIVGVKVMVEMMHFTSVAGQRGVTIDLGGVAPNMASEEAAAVILSRLPSGCVVLDPCMGRGVTGLAAHGAALHTIGIELNPARVADCVLTYSKRAGVKPTRLE